VELRFEEVPETELTFFGSSRRKSVIDGDVRVMDFAAVWALGWLGRVLLVFTMLVVIQLLVGMGFPADAVAFWVTFWVAGAISPAARGRDLGHRQGVRSEGGSTPGG